MTWAPLLLADPSPCLRHLVMRELLRRPDDDPEVRELSALREADSLVTSLVRSQQPDGSWQSEQATSRSGALTITARALMRLGYLGFGPDRAVVQRGADFMFSQQRKDGAWPLPSGREQKEEGEGYSRVPLQTVLPLRGLAACGYATDARAERAYDWLLAQRLPDGAWPTGVASGNLGYVAGYRRLAHSRWGCRSNTTGVLICLALHPERRSSAEAHRALDLLLGRETREQYALGFEVARLIGAELAHGFFTFYARFDLALILDLCWRVGATRDDARVAELAQFIQKLQGTYGLWEYPARPQQISRWLTFDLLRSMSRLDQATDWLSSEPRSPFRAYAKKAKRY